MTLREKIQTEMTAAIRSRDELRRDTLRMVESNLYNAEKAAQRPLADDEVVGLLSREVRTRRESVDAYRKGGREDLAGREEAEIAIISAYLPQALSEAEQEDLVEEAVAATGASSARDLGKVMGWLASRTRGRADGKHLAELVARRLARQDLAAHDAAGRH
ncbi:MAG TPA: GatB/YqeY domain-containing protein [Candidatus Limnocylindrales bacterium]|nr:GatB/YqeY domain-containing protein [Candidatus Limnocylindrales bacterium]